MWECVLYLGSPGGATERSPGFFAHPWLRTVSPPGQVIHTTVVAPERPGAAPLLPISVDTGQVDVGIAKVLRKLPNRERPAVGVDDFLQ